jgi:hypothetical protein
MGYFFWGISRCFINAPIFIHFLSLLLSLLSSKLYVVNVEVGVVDEAC